MKTEKHKSRPNGSASGVATPVKKNTEALASMPIGVSAPRTSPTSATSDTGTTEAYAVGTVVEIHPEDAALIRQTNEKLVMLQARLGLHVDEFAAIEAEFDRIKRDLLANLAQAKGEFRSLVTSIGTKMRLDIGEGSEERWEFLADKMTFIRRG